MAVWHMSVGRRGHGMRRVSDGSIGLRTIQPGQWGVLSHHPVGGVPGLQEQVCLGPLACFSHKGVAIEKHGLRASAVEGDGVATGAIRQLCFSQQENWVTHFHCYQKHQRVTPFRRKEWKLLPTRMYLPLLSVIHEGRIMRFQDIQSQIIIIILNTL